MSLTPCLGLPGSRSEVIAKLRGARRLAASGKRVAILVCGPAGIGKSTLVETAFADMETACYGWGKGEQFGSTHPYRPLIDAIGEAVARWLKSANPEEIEQLHLQMQDFEDVLTALLPNFSALWGSGESPEVPVHEQRHRVPYALRALVAALAKVTPSPLVLVLDDLQWVDDETLRRVERGLADPELCGALGVFCCRDEPDAIGRAEQFLERLSRDGVEVLQTRVLPLTDEEIGHLTAKRLGRSSDEVAPLVRVVCQRSGGSPLYVHHAIEYLAAGGTLEPRVADGDILTLLTHRMADFSDQEREALGLVACSGSWAPIELITRAAAKVLPGLDIASVLERAGKAGLVHLSSDRRSLRMSHDRVQEACAGSPTRWPARHLALWEAGLADSAIPETLADEPLFWLVDRQANASSLLLDHPQRKLAIKLALTASRRARLRGAARVAQRSSALAQRLLTADDPGTLRGAVFVEQAVCSWLLGDRASFESLSRNAERLATPLQFVPVIELRLQASIARGELLLAVNMAVAAARRLWPALPPCEGSSEETSDSGCQRWSDPAEVTQLLEKLRHTTPHHDPTLEAVGRLLSTAHAAAYVGASSRLPALVETELELASRMGLASSFPVTLAFWSALLAARTSTLGQALEVGRFALSLAGPGSDGLVRARTADMVYGMVLCWQGDLRDTIEPLRANSELAISHGTFEYAGYSLLKSFAYRLFTGAPLPELARDIEAGRNRISAFGQARIARYLERDAAVLRRLQEPGNDPSSLSDESFDLEALLEELRSSHDQYGLLYTATSRLLLAVLFEQPSRARALAEEAERLRSGGPGLVHQAMLSWLGALAELDETAPEPEALQRAEAALAHLETVSEHGPTVWLPRAALLRAEMARHRGQERLAEQSYTEALEAAQRCRLSLDEHLICSRRARLALGATRSWKLRAETALALWRGQTAPHANEPPSSQLALQHAANLATAANLEDLGACLVELLWPEISDTQGRVTSPRGRTLASWNGGQAVGCSEIAEVVANGQTLLKPAGEEHGFTLAVPLSAAGGVRAVLLLRAPRAAEEPSSSLCQTLQAATSLAEVALKAMGLGVRLGWAENELADREALYSTLIQESPAGLFARDLQGRVILANKAYAQTNGVALHDLLGRRLSDALPTELAEAELRSDQIAFREARIVETIESSPAGSEPSREYVVLRVPMRDRRGQIAGVCGVSTDVTELRRAREESERSRRLRALGDFAAKIAHDVNNLVTVINCNVELMESRLPGDEGLREELLSISTAASRASELASQILTFGNPRAGTEKLLLSDIASDCCRLFGSTLGDGVTLTTDWSQESEPVAVDRGAIAQVLDNLLTNALHALPPQGGRLQLKISTHQQRPGEPNPLHLRDGVYQCLSVSDDGCGMDPETVRSAFDPFFTTKPHGKGTGLGLSIVHGVLEAHGGAVSVESKPSEGSTFRLYIPSA